MAGTVIGIAPRLSKKCDIFLGEGAFGMAADAAAGRKTFVATDTNVDRLYGARIRAAFPRAKVALFRAGERSKNEKTLFRLLAEMAEFGLQRGDLVVAIGGGVVGDAVGLAAALYMRGVELFQIPTTLLAEVDSSVGGKTAVDFAGVKNLIGAFYQPKKVFIDPMFLDSLPPRELRCGLGEIVKTAALDGELFDFVASRSRGLLDVPFLREAAERAVRVKVRVVEADEFETTGERKKLNVGHTVGHALEMIYRTRSHGQCVLWGMGLEIAASAGKTSSRDEDYLRRLGALCRAAAGDPPPFDPARAAEIASMDKKNREGRISVIAPVSRGRTEEVFFTPDELCAALRKEVNVR